LRRVASLERDVVAQDVKVAVALPHAEVTVIGREPAIGNFSNLDPGTQKPEASRRFLPSVPCMALHVNSERESRPPRRDRCQLQLFFDVTVCTVLQIRSTLVLPQ
jgi:hypothetical protein